MGNSRKWPVGVNPRRDERREEAAARQALRDERTSEEQAELLLGRPGNSRRERSRLAIARLAATKEAKS